MKKMVYLLMLASLSVSSLVFAHGGAHEHDMAEGQTLETLENLRTDGPTMMSSGLPSEKQFELLQDEGVRTVIDLIPGDRSKEKGIVTELGMSYHNIPVDWENPTVENFADYVDVMDSAQQADKGKVLTHCRKNWRGAVFTYLYQVTQLDVPEAQAKAALEKTWQPNETWQKFIKRTKAEF